jgi:hypothetical protein
VASMDPKRNNLIALFQPDLFIGLACAKAQRNQRI